ncbi:cardiolipin synthase [Aquimarina sp. 2201CG1-2-11]|uniref:cardiolipin synthase n=1 Tax=Aquimarina discodermiae TaxID=3231043 RepID=UPI003461DB13
MIIYLVLFIYILIVGLIIFRLLLNGMRPTRTLAWLLAIFTIPVGGMLLYLILGRNRRKNKLFQLKGTPVVRDFIKKALQQHITLSDKEHLDHYKLISLITRNSHFPPSTGNKVKLLKKGKATFEAIFNALDNAKHFIFLEYYIFEEGKLTTKLFELFKQKTSEGVKIYILYDGIGSLSLRKMYIDKLKDIGVEIRKFLPIKFSHFLSSINYRNHRKIVVIDGEIAFTGGINVSDKYLYGDTNLGVWYDMHLKIKGPVVHHLKTIFALDWYLTSKDESILDIPSLPNINIEGQSSVQIVHSGPDDDFSSSQQMFFSIINEAQKYIYITNPYIIPGDSILDALKVAAMSNIDVRLLLSEKSDNVIVRWCVRSYFERLLQAGVKIYLFGSGFLHSKMIVSDDTVSSIGSSNLDIRSFEQNYEVNAVIYHDDFAIGLKNDFLIDCNKSTRLNYHTFLQRPWRHKLKEGAAKIFSPIL